MTAVGGYSVDQCHVVEPGPRTRLGNHQTNFVILNRKDLKYTPRLMKTNLIALFMVALLSGCSADKTAPVAAAAPKPAFGTFGIDTAQMDTTLKPGDDFYKYVNGKWLSTFKIPP